MSKSIIENTQKQKKKMSKKQIVIIVAIGLFLVVGGVGIWYLLNNGSNNPANDDDERQEGALMTNKTARKVDELEQLRLAARDDPDSKYDEIMSGYSNLFDSAVDDQDRQIILLNQAAYLNNIGRYDEALALAKRAEGIIDNLASSNLIAITAELKGDKQMAIEYNNKVLEQYDKSSPMYQSNYDRTKAKISKLESEQ
jgi:tetratricopeptide (TPR) repeat protein